jgi:hypothetical protein
VLPVDGARVRDAAVASVDLHVLQYVYYVVVSPAN